MAIEDAYGTHPTYNALNKHNKDAETARALVLAGILVILALVAAKRLGKNWLTR